MFQNGQPTLLWNNIKENVPIGIALNGTILYDNYEKEKPGEDPQSITLILDAIILCIHAMANVYGVGSPTIGTTSSSVRLHVCAVTHITEISLHVT